MGLYEGYGLTLSADLPLPLPRAHGRRPDIYVHATELDALEEARSQPRLARVQAEAGEILVDADSSSMWCAASPVSDDVNVQMLVLGHPMAPLLSERGAVCIHAAAVATEGGAIAFVAPSGGGKSTLAAACVERGHELVSDDLLPLYPEDGAVSAGWAAPLLRLWLGDGRGRRCRLPRKGAVLGHPGKVVVSCEPRDHGRRRGRIPLVGMFLLGESEDERWRFGEPLTARERFVALRQHLMGPEPATDRQQSAAFHRLAEVANRVWVRPLALPAGLSELDTIVDDVFERAAAA